MYYYAAKSASKGGYCLPSRASHVAKYFLTVCLQLRGRGHFNNCVKGRKRVGSEAFCSLVREYCYLMGAEISQFVEEMLKAK